MRTFTIVSLHRQKGLLFILSLFLIGHFFNEVYAQNIAVYNDNDVIFSPEGSQERANAGNYGTRANSKYPYYNNLRNWIPMDNGNATQHTPLTIIDISFHIFLDDKGENCWFTDDAVGRERLIGSEGLLGVTNRIFDRTEFPASDIVPGVVEIPNTSSRIQFSVGNWGERVYFYKNSSLNTQREGQENMAKNKHPECKNTINIYISATFRPETGSGTWPTITDRDYNVNLYKCAPQYITSSLNDMIWIYGFTLAHEIAHNLKLDHTYCDCGPCCVSGCSEGCTKITPFHPTYPEYLSDIFGAIEQATCPHLHDWTFSPYDNNHPLNAKNTNNLMGGSNTQVYLSPMQVGQMHRSLALYSVGKYVNEATFSPIPLVIAQSEVWDFDLRLFRNLHIKNTLSLYKKLILPKVGKIEVFAGGKFIIEDTLTLQNDIIVRKGGALIIKKDLNFKGANRIQIDSGGYFCIHPDAKINLTDPLSVLNLHENYRLGVPSYSIGGLGAFPPPVSQEYTCTSSLGSIRKTGLGQINTFAQDICISSTTLSGNRYYSGNSITLTTLCSRPMLQTMPIPSGVTVPNGASLILSAEGPKGVSLESNVSVELGASLEIK